jgi:hypothetical protein
MVNAYNKYDSIAISKTQSIFKSTWNGIFKGTTTGFIKIADNFDTLILDFEASKTELQCIMNNHDSLNSTKIYSTKTIDRKISLIYQTYPYSNTIVVILNGNYYHTSLPFDLSFTFFHHRTLEYLKLYAEKPIKLKNTHQTMTSDSLSLEDAEKKAKEITILPGSTIIMTMKK